MYVCMYVCVYIYIYIYIYILGWHKGGGCDKRGCTLGQLIFWTLENHPSVEGLCAPSMRVTSWICEFNVCATIL